MKTFLLALAVTLVAGTAQARTVCTFTTECFEDEACAETQFTVAIEAGTLGPDDIVLVTEAETVHGAIAGAGSVDRGHFIGIGQGAVHMLTVDGASDARYTTHIAEGPMSVSYIGACIEER